CARVDARVRAYLSLREPPPATPFPYTTLFRSGVAQHDDVLEQGQVVAHRGEPLGEARVLDDGQLGPAVADEVGDLLGRGGVVDRSEEHTSELQSRETLVCRLLLEQKQ